MAIFACKNGRFASNFSPLRYRTFKRENCLKNRQICLSKAPLQKPLLNWSGSVFALPRKVRYHWNFKLQALLTHFRIQFDKKNLHLRFSKFQSYTLEIPQTCFLRSVIVFLTGSVSVLFSLLLRQSDLRNSQNLHLHLGKVLGFNIFIGTKF